MAIPYQVDENGNPIDPESASSPFQTPSPPPAPVAPPPPAGPAAVTGAVPPDVWRQLTADLGTGSDTNHQALETLRQRLAAAGYQVQPGPVDPQGRQDSLVINGQLVRAFDSHGAWNYVEDHNGSAWPDSSGGPQGAAGAVDPSYLSPFTTQFPDFYQSLYGRSFQQDQQLPSGLPTLQTPGAFQAPTAKDVFADPSYQFRVNQGATSLENSAAARGVLNTGGTLADLINYGQKAGSQEYSNIFDRKFNLWNADWSHSLEGLGAQVGLNNDAYGRAQDARNTAYNTAWNQYTTNRDTFYKNQDSPFNKLIQTAQLGYGAAAQ